MRAMAAWTLGRVTVEMPDPTPLLNHMLSKGLMGVTGLGDREGNGVLMMMRHATAKGSMGGASVGVARTRAVCSGAEVVFMLALGMEIVASSLKKLVSVMIGR